MHDTPACFSTFYLCTMVSNLILFTCLLTIIMTGKPKHTTSKKNFVYLHRCTYTMMTLWINKSCIRLSRWLSEPLPYTNTIKLYYTCHYIELKYTDLISHVMFGRFHINYSFNHRNPLLLQKLQILQL